MAAERSGDAFTNTRFFKILLSNFSTKLILPASFVKKHITEKDKKASGIANLLGPDGQSWKISFGNDMEKHLIYFSGEEWIKCIQVYDLKEGYLLYFCYEGKMIFNFTVYDLTACEKTYPLITHVSDSNQASGERAKRIRTCTEGHHHFQINGQSNNGKTKAFCCEDCSCIRIETNLAPYNVTESFMRIPFQFRELAGFSKEKHQVTLADPTGRYWPVTLIHNTSACYMGKWWLVFVRANQLKIGDTCAFEMAAGEKDVIHVKKINS